MILQSRRSILTGLAGLIAAPALVRAASIMPVRTWVEPARRVLVINYDANGWGSESTLKLPPLMPIRDAVGRAIGWAYGEDPYPVPDFVLGMEAA